MNGLFTWKNFRKNTMKEHMISISCTRANRAAAPESGLNRIAI